MLQVLGAQAAFLGWYLELESKQENSELTDLRQEVSDLEKQLVGNVKMRSKVVGLEGKIALLGQKNEMLKEDKKMVEQILLTALTDRDALETKLIDEKASHKETKEKVKDDFNQLKFDVSRSYDSGFSQVLEHVKLFHPDFDMFGCDALKKVINGVLVNLVDEEGEDPSDKLSA